MRNVGLDLGVRHIAYCEIVDGKVIERVTVRSLRELRSRLGSDRPPARVAFEACREGWHVYDLLESWGNEPWMVDTTRVRQIGVGHHSRKNDPIDAEAIAKALDADRLPIAHVLSPERRALRAQLSVRAALIETRAQYVTTIRGLARAVGVLLPSCATGNFVPKLRAAAFDETTCVLIAPLAKTLETIEVELVAVEKSLEDIANRDPIIQLCATAPGVGLIVAATFVSVIDEAHRFRNAHAVGAYLGLVPGEDSTGGKRRLGSITKQGNTWARVMLVQAAWHILRLRDHDDALRLWGEHLAQTRGKKIAAVALARKLAGVLWAMWRDGTVYDSARQAEKSLRGVEASQAYQRTREAALKRAARKLERPAASSIEQPQSRPRKSTSEMNAMR
jgi:transposase